MGSFGTDESLKLKLAMWESMAKAAVAGKRAKAAPAAPRAQARTPVRFSLDLTEVAVPRITDFIDPETLSAKVIRAGQMARGELPIPTPTPSGTAAQVLAAGELARGVGPQRPAPEGLAKQILEAGAKRREPRGG